MTKNSERKGPKSIEAKSSHKRTTETIRESWKVNDCKDEEVMNTIQTWLNENLSDNSDLTIVITTDNVIES